MIRRRLPQVVVALITLVAPLTAVAGVPVLGSVTTAPFQPAPVMGMAMLVLLAVVLIGGGAYLVGSAAGRASAKVGLVVVLAALAGLAYADGVVRVQGAQCGMQTVQEFLPASQTLLSECQNLIQIISIQLSCATGMPVPGTCSEHQVLAFNGSCILPRCPHP